MTLQFYASRKFEDLHPHVAKLARGFVIECEAQSCPVLIVSTYRSKDAIAALDELSRRRIGNKHHVRDYEYFHAFRVAFDFVPILHGKCQWHDEQAFYKCGKIAEEMGLEWGGRFDGKDQDYEHCQFTGGISLLDYFSGKMLPADGG